MKQITLFTFSKAGLTLADALAATGPQMGGAPVGLFYTPASCGFATWDGKAFLGPDGRTLDLGGVFEARVFDDKGELRWLMDPESTGRTGQAAFLTEHTSLVSGWDDGKVPNAYRLDNEYLLWGEAWDPGTAKLQSGWSCLASRRINTLPVPVAGLKAHDRVRLCTAEYLGPAPGDAGTVHGNTVVIEERLLGLQPVKAQSAKEDRNG